MTFDLAAVVLDPDAAGNNVELADSVRAANADLAARIREIGPKRVLFARDWPAWPPMPDPRLKLAQNLRLLHKALPLERSEWAVIHANPHSTFFAERSDARGECPDAGAR